MKRESAAPVDGGAFRAVADVVVVGGGGGGLARGAVRALAGRRGDPAREGARARRHGQEGGVLVLDSEQPLDAGGRDRGPRGGLPALHGAALAPAAVRPLEPDAGAERVGARADPRDLRERLARRRAAGRARRAALPLVRGGARLLVRAARGQGADRSRARARGRARDDVRRRPGRHPHDERRGRARRRRRPRLAPRAAARDRRRRGRWRRGDAGRTARCGWARARR